MSDDGKGCMPSIASCQHGRGCYFKRTQPPQSKLSIYVVVKVHLKVLSVLMNYKHLHQIYLMQNVITSSHAVDNGYLFIRGCFTKVKAHKSP
jgi:hypothetical protein